MLFGSLTATSSPQPVKLANVPDVVMSNGSLVAQSAFLTAPHDHASQPTSSACACASSVRYASGEPAQPVNACCANSPTMSGRFALTDWLSSLVMRVPAGSCHHM